MKKGLVVLLSILLICSMVFVSCENNDMDADATGNVKFVDGSSLGKSLNRVEPGFDSESLYWGYEAVKRSATELLTGQTSGITKIAATEDGKAIAGLSNHVVGPFSLGNWEFTLYGYVDSECTKLVYTGNAIATIRKGNANRIAVTVSTIQSPNGKGSIEFPEIKNIRNSNGDLIEAKSLVEVVEYVKDAPGAVKQTADLSQGRRIDDLDVGGYLVTVSWKDEKSGEFCASSSVYVNVYDNLTSTYVGDIDENTENAGFEVTDGVKVTSSPVSVAHAGPTELSVTTTPENEVSGNKTTVSVPQGQLANTTATVSITSFSTASSNSAFEATSEGVAVGALDIVVKDGDQEKHEFSKPITITTYIAKNLPQESVSVKYNGSSAKPNITLVEYVPVDGKLVFTTDHLSEYYVVADVEAMNKDTGAFYATLEAALTAAKPAETVVMLKDAVNTDYAGALRNITVKETVLEGNKHVISGNVHITVDKLGGTARNIIFKNIHNQETPDNGDIEKYGLEGKTGGLCAIQSGSTSGSITIEDCVFDTVDWDAIQITPVAGADIAIINNVFDHDSLNTVGISKPIRQVHIESSPSGCDFKLKVTGNCFYGVTSMKESSIYVGSPSNSQNIDLTGNYFEKGFRFGLKGNGFDSEPYKALMPFGTGLNGEKLPEFNAGAKFNNNTYMLEETLAEALDAADYIATVYILSDYVVDKPINVFKNMSLYLHGHTLRCDSSLNGPAFYITRIGSEHAEGVVFNVYGDSTNSPIVIGDNAKLIEVDPAIACGTSTIKNIKFELGNNASIVDGCVKGLIFNYNSVNSSSENTPLLNITNGRLSLRTGTTVKTAGSPFLRLNGGSESSKMIADVDTGSGNLFELVGNSSLILDGGDYVGNVSVESGSKLTINDGTYSQKIDSALIPADKEWNTDSAGKWQLAAKTGI